MVSDASDLTVFVTRPVSAVVCALSLFVLGWAVREDVPGPAEGSPCTSWRKLI